MLALAWMLPSVSWSLPRVLATAPRLGHLPPACLLLEPHPGLLCGLESWTRRQSDTRPGLPGRPWARAGRHRPPASGPLCPMGPGPGPWPSWAGWGLRFTPFGVGMWPGCTAMPQGPPINRQYVPAPARGARFPGLLPLVALWPRKPIVRNPPIPARALLPRETDIRGLGALATEVQKQHKSMSSGLLKCIEWKVFLLQAPNGDGVGGVGTKRSWFQARGR